MTNNGIRDDGVQRPFPLYLMPPWVQRTTMVWGSELHPSKNQGNFHFDEVLSKLVLLVRPYVFDEKKKEKEKENYRAIIIGKP